MKEYGSNQLHSGSKSGPVVTNRKQAVAIGLSEQKKLKGGGSIGGGAATKGRSFGGNR